MSWFVLMEMTLVAVMTVYLAYHTHLVFAKAKYRKIITTVIIGILIGLCLYNLIFFGFLANACICFVIFDIINLIYIKLDLIVILNLFINGEWLLWLPVLF